MRPDQCGGSFAERGPLACRSSDPGSCALGVLPDRRRRAQSRPLVFAVDIGRIVDPADGALGEPGAQRRSFCAEQGAQQPRPSVIQGCRRHPCEPAPITWSLGAARPAHVDRLDLVVERMPGQHEVSAFRGRGLCEQSVARLARRSREAGRRFGRCPAQRPMRDALRMAKRGDCARFLCRLGAQAMVDCHGDDLRRGRTPAEMILEEEQQAPANRCHRRRRPPGAGLSASSNRPKILSLSILATLEGGAQHAARASSCLTRCFSASDDLG